VSRLERLAGLVEEPFLVTKPVNVRYLTGFESSNAAVLVEPAGAATLFTDFRYVRRARELEGVAVVETARAVVGALAERLSGRTIGIEAGHLTVAGRETLDRGGVATVPRSDVVEGLRLVKDEAELDALRRASAISDAVFAALPGERFVGRTERDLVWRVEELFHEHGGQGMSFATSVAAGPSAASPHADPGDRAIEPNTLVIIDAGCFVDGYASDCTRTYATGELPDQLAQAYALCLESQLAGLAAVRPGVTARDADAASRAPIEAAGLGAAYGHGMGHGVGLEIHEAPALRPESDDVLAAGNVHSVEPGIYLDGVGGVRIEDLVVVTEEGCERLTLVEKELVAVE